MISVEHMDELIVRFSNGELDIRDVIEQSYFGGREDMLTDIKAKARKYHRGKSEPVKFVIYDNELEQLKEQK